MVECQLIRLLLALKVEIVSDPPQKVYRSVNLSCGVLKQKSLFCERLYVVYPTAYLSYPHGCMDVSQAAFTLFHIRLKDVYRASVFHMPAVVFIQFVVYKPVYILLSEDLFFYLVVKLVKYASVTGYKS